MPFEVLDFPLVFFRRSAGFEGAEISTFAGLGILLARVQPEFARLKFCDHR
jgi:hypothetical protein